MYAGSVIFTILLQLYKYLVRLYKCCISINDSFTAHQLQKLKQILIMAENLTMVELPLENKIEQKDDFMALLKNYIAANVLESDLSADKVAKAFGISRTQLFRKIKVSTDQTLGIVIREIRCEIALKLMREENLTMSDIAYRVGFSSLSHFSKTFKKVYGKSPTKMMLD